MRGNSFGGGFVIGFDCGPKGGRAPSPLRFLAGDGAQGGELLEGGVDALAANMALEEGSYLIAG